MIDFPATHPVFDARDAAGAAPLGDEEALFEVVISEDGGIPGFGFGDAIMDIGAGQCPFLSKVVV